MFVEQSLARLRLARWVFVTVCLLPAAGLVGWAWYHRSGEHVEAILADCSQSLGMRVDANRIEHLRPGTVRLEAVSLAGRDGMPVAEVSEAVLERRATGLRLAIPELLLGDREAAGFGPLAIGWLTDPVSFPGGCVLQIERFRWRQDGPLWGGGLLVECVATDAGRAIRICRSPSDGDELRLRWEPGEAGGRIEALLTCGEPIPLSTLASAIGWLPDLGEMATVRGRFTVVREEGRWTAAGSGSVDRVDLARLAGLLGRRAMGEASLELVEFGLSDGRLERAEVRLDAEEGRLGGGLVDSLVTVLGCRGGASLPEVMLPLGGGERGRGSMVPFRSISLIADLDSRGLRLRGFEGASAGVVEGPAAPILLPPVGRVACERLAWLFPADNGAAIPASAGAARLLLRLPRQPGDGPARSASLSEGGGEF
jgi:hypothetical protein